MKKLKNVRVALLAVAIIAAASFAVYAAQNQISLDSPASLPSDI